MTLDQLIDSPPLRAQHLPREEYAAFVRQQLADRSTPSLPGALTSANRQRIMACVNALASVPLADLQTALAFPDAAERLCKLSEACLRAAGRESRGREWTAAEILEREG